MSDLLSKRPFELAPNRKYNAEFFNYIIHLLFVIPATNKKILTEEDYVPFNSWELNKHVYGYRKYLDYLIKQGIIETDNHYTVKEDATNDNPVKCKGYRLKSKYLTSPRIVETENKTIRTISRRIIRMSRREREKYHHLIKWLNPALKIDERAAKDYIENWYEYIKDKPEQWGFTKKRKQKDPQNTLLAGLVGIDMLKRHDFVYTVDRTSRRFHSNLTNLKKELRHFITYDGHELVGLDLKNSQPFLGLLLFEEDFWKNKMEFLNAKDIGQYKLVVEVLELGRGSKSSIYHMLDKSAEIKHSSEFQLYQFLVKSGGLYQYLYDQITDGFELPYDGGITNFKLEFIKSLYAANQFNSAVKQKFKDLFPKIHGLFSVIRKHKKERLPIILQSIESTIFLLRITKRIAKEMPWLPIFSIHDNIITIKGHEDRVLEIAKDEITKCVGSTPEFGKEFWNPINITHSNIMGQEPSSNGQIINPSDLMNYFFK